MLISHLMFYDNTFGIFGVYRAYFEKVSIVSVPSAAMIKGCNFAGICYVATDKTLISFQMFVERGIDVSNDGDILSTICINWDYAKP